MQPPQGRNPPKTPDCLNNGVELPILARWRQKSGAAQALAMARGPAQAWQGLEALPLQLQPWQLIMMLVNFPKLRTQEKDRKKDNSKDKGKSSLYF